MSLASTDTTLERLERRLYRTTRAACEAYALLEPDDHVMVAMSGGKDSYSLFTLLTKLVPRLPFPVRLTAVHLDQKQPGYDGAPLVAFLEKSGWPFEILAEDTYSVVTTHVKEGATYCSLCSRLRRGVLYGAAERLGCNKIALGHHRDDSLETFLLNLFYAGKLQAMPAKYRTDDGRFDVIRPLVDCAEKDIAAYAAQMGYPILPCNLCGSQENLKRDKMTELLNQLEKDNPNLRAIMANALRNVRPTHLNDLDVARAWFQAGGEDRRAPRAPAPEPVADGRRLRLIGVSNEDSER
ncbi:MAG: tRNA 2-thiocytidine(32) synthetase TtcA [Myxococcales bacterium]|nr:tRNA 2-thiocytidine(32) synthetase TtcA [Myxococcales bacterium]